MSVAKAGRHCTCATHYQFGRVMVIRGLRERLARKQLCEWPGDSGGQQAVHEPAECPSPKRRVWFAGKERQEKRD